MQEIFGIPTAAAGVISDAPRVSSILLNVSNFLLSIVGVVAIIALIVAGLLYLTAYGDQRKLAFAKKITIASIVGIVIALSALVIIKTALGILE